MPRSRTQVIAPPDFVSKQLQVTNKDGSYQTTVSINEDSVKLFTGVVQSMGGQVTDIPEWRQPVIRMPLTQAFPALSEVKEFRSRVCLFNHSRTKVFDVVSPRYQLVENSSAVDVVEAALAKYFGAKPGDLQFNIRTLRNGAAIRGEVKLPIKPIKLDGRDYNELTLLLRNSYDRSCPFSAELGCFRIICSNGAKIGTAFGAITARHVGGGTAELGDGQDSILDQLGNIVTRAPLVREVWQEWSEQPMTLEQAREFIDGWKLPDMYAHPIFEPGRWKQPRTKWQFYNDLTHMSTHLTRSMQRRLDFEDTIAKLFYNSDAVDRAEMDAEDAGD